MTDSKKTSQTGACACGQAHFTIQGPALLRAICHCSLCQQFNQADYADVVAFRGGDVSLPADAPVRYQTLRPPPAVQRGSCTACGKPAIERLPLPLLPDLIMVPAANLPAELLPPVAMHIFYDSRVQDVADTLPKFQGYWPSQLGYLRRLLPGLLGKPPAVEGA